MQATLQSPRIFGMLDHGGSFGLKPGINYTLWNTNQHPFQNLTAPKHNSHPFFLNQLKNDQFIGVFMHNSNAMQFQIQPHLRNTSVFWRMAGGVIDLYIFHSSDAYYIIKKYHQFIGCSYPTPFWGMGFHHSNDSYTKTAQLQATVQLYQANNMPIESIGTGISMSDDGKAFTINSNFGEIKQFIQKLHNPQNIYNMYFIATIIPALKNVDNYNYTQFLIGNNSGVMN